MNCRRSSTQLCRQAAIITVFVPESCKEIKRELDQEDASREWLDTGMPKKWGFLVCGNIRQFSDVLWERKFNAIQLLCPWKTKTRQLSPFLTQRAFCSFSRAKSNMNETSNAANCENHSKNVATYFEKEQPILSLSPWEKKNTTGVNFLFLYHFIEKWITLLRIEI